MNIQDKKNYYVHKPQYKVKRVPKIKKVKELHNEYKEAFRRRREFRVQYEPWET